MTDTHAHYDDPAFDADRDEVIQKALGTSRIIINAGTDIPGSKSSIVLAQRNDRIYAAVGIHPQYDGDISVIDILCRESKVVAVGEIGLDYRNADSTEKAWQISLFISQLGIAKKYNLPVIIHCVDAWGDMLGILKEHPAAGVLHGFTGSAETAAQAVRLGMYIGFGGRVTYPMAKRAAKALMCVPEERLLLETDAPYAPPYRYRDQRCEGYMIADTAEYIAGMRGITTEELSVITDRNTQELFGISV